jgi:hypothetical protein
MFNMSTGKSKFRTPEKTEQKQIQDKEELKTNSAKIRQHTSQEKENENITFF